MQNLNPMEKLKIWRGHTLAPIQPIVSFLGYATVFLYIHIMLNVMLMRKLALRFALSWHDYHFT